MAQLVLPQLVQALLLVREQVLLQEQGKVAELLLRVQLEQLTELVVQTK